MTKGSEEFVHYVLDALKSVGAIQAGRFFGGVGISDGHVQFAMIMGNSVYCVVDDRTRPLYEALGMQPFSYTTKKGRVQVRKYYELPEDVLSDSGELKQWIRQSIDAATRCQSTSKKPSRI
jgi:DNA transformation protein